MYDPDLSRSLHVDIALVRLQHDFPRVPDRVVVDVLDACVRVFPSMQLAVDAARIRIADACATA